MNNIKMNYRFSVYLDKPQRVDIYMSALFEDFSRSYIQKMIDKEQLKVNGNILSKNLKIKNKDEISLEIKTESLDIKPEKMSLDIVYEDSEILIINKEA
jgi:23S rRNA pseudouridine1911/1915/1917 synthase